MRSTPPVVRSRKLEVHKNDDEIYEKGLTNPVWVRLHVPSNDDRSLPYEKELLNPNFCCHLR